MSKKGILVKRLKPISLVLCETQYPEKWVFKKACFFLFRLRFCSFSENPLVRYNTKNIIFFAIHSSRQDIPVRISDQLQMQLD